MDEKKWMDQMVCQRMELLLDEFYRCEEKGKTAKEAVRTQAEAAVKGLTREELENLDRFLDQIMERSSRETSYLYFCGLKDGIRIMKFINSL